MNTPSDKDLRIRLELSSLPDSVGLVRAVVRTVGGSAELDTQLVDDMRSAISEACNNVILHAYPDGPGPLVFSMTIQGDSIEAVVRDQGSGIRPGPARNRGLGMGVTLINSLADRAEFQSSELGTEVRMRFNRPARPAPSRSALNLEIWTLTDPQASDALRARSS